MRPGAGGAPTFGLVHEVFHYSSGICAADVDASGAVDFGDLLLILVGWGPCPPECPLDLDGSGAVDFDDLLLVLTNWGPCP